VNFKISGIIGGLAFVLSLLIGLVSGARVFALVRALIFAAAFFVISGCAYGLILRFLPELLESPDTGDAVPQTGSLVDIALEDDTAEVMPEADVGDYVSTEEKEPSGIAAPDDPSGLDQTDDIGYTNEGDMDKNPAVQENGAEPALLMDTQEMINELPDLESLSSAFSAGGGRKGENLSEFMIDSNGLAGGKPGGSGKPSGLTSEFDTQDMASAIQTILKRE
jgi:hypothetical protein